LERTIDKPTDPLRRNFLNACLGGSFVMAVGVALYGIGSYLWPPKEESGGAQDKVLVASLADLSPGKSKIFKFQGRPYIAVNYKGVITALSAVCTHLGCIVMWEEDKSRLYCPCHAAVFDTNGNVRGGPAPKPLSSLKVEVVKDQVLAGGA
jgi:cytochrome b6-f complex iron-sulfur subunit